MIRWLLFSTRIQEWRMLRVIFKQNKKYQTRTNDHRSGRTPFFFVFPPAESYFMTWIEGAKREKGNCLRSSGSEANEILHGHYGGRNVLPPTRLWFTFTARWWWRTVIQIGMKQKKKEPSHEPNGKNKIEIHQCFFDSSLSLSWIHFYFKE